MSSNHSSRLLLVISALVIVAGVLGGAAALSTDVPETAREGSTVNATFTFNQTDLYGRQGQYARWTLRGETGLTNATWTVVGYDNTNTVINRTIYPREGGDGSTFTHPIDSEDGVVRLRIEIEGQVPNRSADRYSFSPPQSLAVATFKRVRGNSHTTLLTATTRPYTERSQAAREAIERAKDAVKGSGSTNAKRTLGDAIEFFNAGKFGNAIDAAERAERQAKQARQRSQLIQTAIYVVVGVLVLGAIVGAVWWYRKNQQASRL